MNPVPPRVLAIMEEVAAKHKVTTAELRGRCRRRPISAARHEAAWRMRNMPGARPPSYPMIGRWLGREHATVMESVRRHESFLAQQALAA